MRKKVIATVAATAFAIAAVAAPVAAGGGQSSNAQIHPGHLGYVNSGGTGGGIPSVHFHGVGAYDSWNEVVVAAAQNPCGGGVPGAHTCQP